MENMNDEMIYYPSQSVIEQANIKEYDQLYARSIENPEVFWSEQAEQLSWYRKWDKVLDRSNPPFFKWFEGGKTNIVLNAIDRHLENANRNKLALIWEGERWFDVKHFNAVRHALF